MKHLQSFALNFHVFFECIPYALGMSFGNKVFTISDAIRMNINVNVSSVPWRTSFIIFASVRLIGPLQIYKQDSTRCRRHKQTNKQTNKVIVEFVNANTSAYEITFKSHVSKLIQLARLNVDSPHKKSNNSKTFYDPQTATVETIKIIARNSTDFYPYSRRSANDKISRHRWSQETIRHSYILQIQKNKMIYEQNNTMGHLPQPPLKIIFT